LLWFSAKKAAPAPSIVAPDRKAPREVARAGHLDLDDLRAEFGQPLRRKGASHGDGEVQDA
jgi:hypothetical protein